MPPLLTPSPWESEYANTFFRNRLYSTDPALRSTSSFPASSRIIRGTNLRQLMGMYRCCVNRSITERRMTRSSPHSMAAIIVFLCRGLLS